MPARTLPRPSMMSDKKTIDFLASEPHYAYHAKKLYDALPSHRRGVFALTVDELLKGKSAYVAVFSFKDLRSTTLTTKSAVFFEHGAGMYYNESHPAYAGSDVCRDNVVARLSPNKTHAAKEELANPGMLVEVTGMLSIDEYVKNRHDVRREISNSRHRALTTDPAERLNVALSFHWDCKVCPETMTTWEHYKGVLYDLTSQFNVMGHGHPRIIDRLEKWYQSSGVEVTRAWSRVLKRADVYVCDNSSTIFEFAATGKPVVLLNAPQYRRGVEHEGNPRFWKHSDIGPQVNEPDELVEAIRSAWLNNDKYAKNVERALPDVVGYVDGLNTSRAVWAIMSLLE